jgi:hypothetical protein
MPVAMQDSSGFEAGFADGAGQTGRLFGRKLALHSTSSHPGSLTFYVALDVVHAAPGETPILLL